MRKKTVKNKYFEGIGRRKSSIARVRLYIIPTNKEISVNDNKIKKGTIIVNNKDVAQYFSGTVFNQKYLQPLHLTQSLDRYAFIVKINGGGLIGQLESMILGISRALEKVDENNRLILKKEKLLTRDSRIRERRKPGTGGKARRKKQSPKR